MIQLFLLNPFIALVIAISDLRKPFAKNILWLFVVFIGLTWQLKPGSTSDNLRYIQKLELMHRTQMSFFEFQEMRGDVDVFSNGLTYVISRFTGYGPVLVIAQSIIFGFFFSRNMAFVFQRFQGNIKPITYALFFGFFMTMPMWSFNGFRFNLATHVFVYGLLNFFFQRKKSGLVICYLTPFLFHYAFLLPAAILSVYLVLGNRTNIYFGLFIFSLFFAEFDLKQFNTVIETYLPSSFSERSQGYRTESALEKKKEFDSQELFGGKTSWHALLYKKSLFWSINILVIYFYLRRKKIGLLHARLPYIFAFVLLFLSFSNFMMNVPSGGRYSVVISLFALAFISIYVQNSSFDRLGLRLTKIVAPMILFFGIVSAREGLSYISLTTIIGNPVVAIFTIGENVNLETLIK